MNKDAAPWERCDCCDDFVCNIHPGQHVADCDCPPIDTWAEYDLFPYEPIRPEALLELAGR